jgi:hypothetical protein
MGNSSSYPEDATEVDVDDLRKSAKSAKRIFDIFVYTFLILNAVLVLGIFIYTGINVNLQHHVGQPCYKDANTTIACDNTFWVRDRSTNLDWIMFYLWIEASIGFILLIIISVFVLADVAWEGTKMTEKRSKRMLSWAFLFLFFNVAFLLFDIIVMVLLFIRSGSFNGVSIGGPFSNTNPYFYYGLDNIIFIICLLSSIIHFIGLVIPSYYIVKFRAFKSEQFQSAGSQFIQDRYYQPSQYHHAPSHFGQNKYYQQSQRQYERQLPSQNKYEGRSSNKYFH